MINKCAHPACSCLVQEKWAYCSAKCASGNPGNAGCDCDHVGCKGRRSAASCLKMLADFREVRS